MEELISKITQATGLDGEQARNAVGTVLGFLQQEGPGEAVSQSIDMKRAAEQLENETAKRHAGFKTPLQPPWRTRGCSRDSPVDCDDTNGYWCMVGRGCNQPISGIQLRMNRWVDLQALHLPLREHGRMK